MQKKQLFKRIGALVLIPCILSGCGTKKVEKPELIESVAEAETYRIVERGSVGDETIWYGFVVPNDYHNEWNIPVKVEEINVEIGDYVHEGDVLAVIDDDEIKYNREMVQNLIDKENELENFRANIYNLEHQELELKISDCDQSGDTQGADAARNELVNLEENRRYDIMMHEFRISEYNKQMSKVNKIANTNSLTASHEGYVTYIKDLSETDVVGAYENVVTVSDYNDRHLEVSGYTVDKFKKNEKMINKIYTVVSGKKYELTESEYSPRELVEMEQKEVYEDLNVKSADNTQDIIQELELGTAIPVYFETEMKEDVIRVSNDSIFEDGQGSYVYVKTQHGKETRYIKTGEESRYYTEVTEGLKEGEAVFYQLSEENIIPTDYELTEVDYESYTSDKEAGGFTFETYKTKNYYAKSDGVVSEISIYNGEEISKGSCVLEVDTVEGGAVLADIQNNMNALTVQHQEILKGYDEEITANNELIAGLCATQNKTTETESQAESEAEINTQAVDISSSQILQLQLRNQCIGLKKEMENVNYSYDYSAMQREYQNIAKDNDGSGTLRLKSEEDGVLVNVKVVDGQKVKEGEKLFATGVPIEPVVVFSSQENLHLNQKVIIAQNGDELSGTIVGVKENNKYIVKMDDPDITELSSSAKLKYSSMDLDKIIILPEEGVFSDVKKSITTADSDSVTYYVWKDIDGVLTKQYVSAIKVGSSSEVYYCITKGLTKGDKVAVLNKEEE